jgi:uncharacterized delta-60 repeat protein
VICAQAFAAPGDLDPSFSTDGKVTRYDDALDLYTALVAPDFTDAALALNGTIVVSGESGLHRFKPDGTEARSFSTEDDPPRLAALEIQPNGKIVAVGDYPYYSAEHGDFLVQRYNTDGTPDDTFGTDGQVLTDFSGHEDVATSVAIQPDGRIVVAGYAAQSDPVDAPPTEFALARYDSDGTLDPTFSGDGKQTTDFTGRDVAEGIAIQPNGKIVVGGSAAGDLAAARYMADGAADSSFSGDGKTRAGFADPHAPGGQAVAVQPNGRVMVAGGENGQFALARFSANGSLDRSFSGDGTVATQIPPSSPYFPGSAAYDVIVRGDRILAAGNQTGDFALAQYLPNGALDKRFSGDGMLTTEFGTTATEFDTDDSAAAIVPQSNAVIVAGSSASYAGPEFSLDGALARYLTSDGPADADADGVLDSSDLCPNVFESGAADGCPVYPRSLEAEVRRHPGYVYFRFWASSPAACDPTVKVYKLRRGQRREIREGALRLAGHGYGRQLYETAVHGTRGQVYATIDESVTPDFGRCGHARSNLVRLRHP